MAHDQTNHTDDLDTAYNELTVEPTPRERRDRFAAARRALVDEYVAASAGTLDFRAFNGVEIEDFPTIAAEHGIRPPSAMAAENAALRAALAAEVAGRHRHLAVDDLADILTDPTAPFDVDAVNARAAEVEAQRSEGARNMLTNALAELGVDTTGDDFDVTAVLTRAANPAPPADPVDPYADAAYRTANLPKGQSAVIPARWHDNNLTGEAALEAAATETLRELGIR